MTTTQFAPKYLCNDCGVDVLETGDWYLAPSEIWEKTLGFGWNDNLCLACLERPLGPSIDRWLWRLHSGLLLPAPLSRHFGEA